jgi:hypothetical protein
MITQLAVLTSEAIAAPGRISFHMNARPRPPLLQPHWRHLSHELRRARPNLRRPACPSRSMSAMTPLLM